MNKPNVIIVMGVSGTGKSTLAQRLAEQFGGDYLDADSFHTPESKALMSQGVGISQAARQQWFEQLISAVERASKEHITVLAFSGLIKAHRLALSALPINSLFVLLQGDSKVIYQRLNHRTNHFAPPELLVSQLETFQAIDAEQEQVLLVDIAYDTASQIGLVTAYAHQCWQRPLIKNNDEIDHEND